MNSFFKTSFLFISLFLIASCGGGGGGGSSEPSGPPPTVQLSSNNSSTEVGTDISLTWSSTNSTSCSASWTNQTGTSGTQSVTVSKAGINSYAISCSGSGGSRSATTDVEGFYMVDGVSIDGYISGASIFVDANENFILDADENSTSSGTSGEFNIKLGNSALVSIGGQDVDTQTQLDNFLMVRNLSGYTADKYMVTPITSIAYFKPDLNIYSSLGLDSSVDVFKSDPVANKGDGGAYDLLYEKGNQLTILALSMQNMTNNLNSSTDNTADYFKAISEEIDLEYSSSSNIVNIENNVFIEKVVDNIIATKSLTIDSSNKENVVSALASVLPVVGVKSTDELTNAVVNFGINKLQTDLITIASGSAEQTLINSYKSDVLNYISSDQSVDSNDITPTIITFNDTVAMVEDGSITFSPLRNDSYIPGDSYTLSITNPSNGTASIVESSPEQITYVPNTNFNGQDAMTYTLSQNGDTKTSTVLFVITAENDAPVINTNSTINYSENDNTPIDIEVSDVDNDELTIAIGGADIDSFNFASETNLLTFKNTPDYETKNKYQITITANDGQIEVLKAVTISIVDVNENPQGYKVPSSIDVIETKE